jgi:hypothetical protein
VTACAACSHAPTQGSAAASTAVVPDAETFRNIFYTHASATGLSSDDISKLIYLPTDAMTGSVDQSSTASVDSAFQGIKPSDLYNYGLSKPMQAVDNVDGALAQKPVTIIIFPGIFGEFITNSPFQEVFNNQSSSFAVKVQQALTQAAGTDAATDEAYSLNTLGVASQPLSNLLSAGSIDSAGGAPLVNVLYMKPLPGSLESMGTLSDDTAIYIRRLTKFWTVLGGATPFYVLGYSRGATVAFDFAAQAPSIPDWGTQLAGVITLGGVNFGTPLADATADASQPIATVFSDLQTLMGALTECQATDSTFTRAKVVASDTAAWVAHGTPLLAHATLLPKHQELNYENLSSSTPDLSRLWTMAINLLTQDVLRIDKPVSDYCGNVSRFKAFAQKMVDGVQTLTTANRIAWWQNNTLPAGLRVLAVTGTMGDPTPGAGQAWALTGNSTAYDADSVDYKGLRSSYYDIYDGVQLALNDSQVPTSRAWLWPDLIRSYNAAQPAIETHVVAVLGEHHWGFAFPASFPQANGEVDPFPRTVLMHSLGTFIAGLDAAAAIAATGDGGAASDDGGTTGDDGGQAGDDGGSSLGDDGGGSFGDDGGNAPGDDGGDEAGDDGGSSNLTLDAGFADDTCSGIPDGSYCGGDQVEGNSVTLFTCASGALQNAQLCANSCQVNGNGTDVCQ